MVNQIDDATLLELFHELVHAFRTTLQTAIAGDESGLAMMEARALGFIACHDGATAGDLAKSSGRDKGQIARLLGELVVRGLVVRAEGSDRRTHTLHLTTEGKSVHRRLERRHRRAAAAMFASFSPAERATLAELLGRLTVGPRGPCRR